MTNVFLRWYTLFCETSPAKSPKTPADIGILRSLSDRYLAIICIIYISYIIYIICVMPIIHIIYLDFRLLQLFKTVFPHRNGLGRLIMDTEKVHFIKHCHVDEINYANPINCCCDGPKGGHKTWVHEQGLKTNQGPSAAMTLMTHSLNKEASQLLCDAMQCRLEDGDAAAEDWTDSKGNSLRPYLELWN